MKQRDQLFLFFAKRLEYLSLEQVQILSSQPDAAEKQVRYLKFLNEAKLMHLRFLVIKHYLLQNAIEAKLITQTQYQQLIEKKISSLQQGEAILTFASLEKGWLPASFFWDTADELLQKNILNAEECAVLTAMLPPKKPPTTISLNESSRESVDALVLKYTPTQLEKIGEYKIHKKIGRGGMGEVYEATHPHLEKLVAIKVLQYTQEISLQDRQRFLNEAQIMASLQHPNIVSVYDVGMDGNIDYIVMELVNGNTLKGILDKKSPFSIRKTLQLMKQIALTVEYAHQNGIIHRDLKPSNLMLDQNNRLLVMDFGLAKNIKSSQQLTQSGDILGTPQYMAPEQIQGKIREIAATTDVYALGAILYEMLCGVKAVTSKELGDVMFDVVYRTPVPLRAIKPRLAFDLEILCFKAMEKMPQMRYKSAKNFANDIGRFLRGEALVAQANPLWRKKYKKSKWMVVVAMFFLAIFIAIEAKNKQELEARIVYYSKKANTLLKKSKTRLKANKIELYIQASDFLEKALVLDFENKNIRQKLYKLQKQIGSMALKHKNYLLSYVAFKRCEKLQNTREAKSLLALISKDKLSKRNFLKKIMNKIQGKHLSYREIEYWATKIVRENVFVKEIILYLQKTDIAQRYVAIRALGRLKDTTTKIKGKKSVDYLLAHLQKIDPQKFPKEAEELIWALAMFKDPQTGYTIYQVRAKFSNTSSFWERTQIPFSWIPTAKLQVENFHSLFVSGAIKQGKKNYQGAIVDFSKAILLNNKDTTIYNNRGYTYHLLGKFDKAIADFKKAIAINPKNFHAFLNMGLSYESKKQMLRATKCFSKSIEIMPTALAYNNRGNAYYVLNNKMAAIADFNKSIKLNPNYIDPYVNRANVYTNLGEMERAYQDFSKAIAINPKNAAVYHMRAIHLEEKRDIAGAIGDYTFAIKLNPRLVESYNNRGLLFEELGEFQRALGDYNRAIALSQNNPKIYNNRAGIYSVKKLYGKALKDYNKALQIDPQCVDSYFGRAIVKEVQGNIDGAIADYSKVIVLDPKDAQGYNNRGLLFEEQGYFYKALKDYNQAINLKPYDYQGYVNRANTYDALQKPSKALKDYNRAVLLGEKYAIVYKARAIFYSRSSKHRLAVVDFRKYLALAPNAEDIVKIKNYIKEYEE